MTVARFTSSREAGRLVLDKCKMGQLKEVKSSARQSPARWSTGFAYGHRHHFRGVDGEDRCRPSGRFHFCADELLACRQCCPRLSELLSKMLRFVRAEKRPSCRQIIRWQPDHLPEGRPYTIRPSPGRRGWFAKLILPVLWLSTSLCLSWLASFVIYQYDGGRR